MSSRRGSWDEEVKAIQLLAALLDGTGRQVDPGGGTKQLHDYDLTLPEGRVVAVEVTRHAHDETLATLAERDKRTWTFDFLRHDWHISMASVYKAKAVAERLPTLMRTIETSGVESLILRHDLVDGTPSEMLSPDARARRSTVEQHGLLNEVRQLLDLGVRAFVQIGTPAGRPGRLALGEAPSGGAVGPGTLAQVAELHASKPDNLAKLRGAKDRDERHLFVWVEVSAKPADGAFSTLRLAGLPPEPVIDECIDTVWLVSAYENACVLRWQRNHGWTDHGYMPLTTE